MIINKANLVFNAPFIKRANTNRIILHHTGETVLQSVEVIHDYYLHKFDPDGSTYIGIGYNYYIRKDGSIWEGRPEWARGGHAGLANEDSIGICCEGNFMIEQMTTVQRDSMFWLVNDINTRNGKLKIQGHCEVMPTDCPGTNFPLTAVKNMVSNPVTIVTPVATPASPAPIGIQVGNKVKMTGSKYTTGQTIPLWAKLRTYDVLQVMPNKILVGIGKAITGWINSSEAKKV